MTIIDATGLTQRALNEAIGEAGPECTVTGCLGQRFIATGAAAQTIRVEGTPGNALGAYLNGAKLEVFGNAQDAVGDTMNDGEIIIHGNVGDTVGYAMRGGEIFVRGNAGYRAGIHMKAYADKLPVMVIGGRAGSFLGEYQAGGLILVLGIGADNLPPVTNFCGTGMHGGKIILRGNCESVVFPPQVTTHVATAEDLQSIRPYLEKFATLFGLNAETLAEGPFTVVSPNSANPYRQLYVAN